MKRLLFFFVAAATGVAGALAQVPQKVALRGHEQTLEVYRAALAAA